MITIAFLTTDNREQHRKYDLPVPYFGTAMDALLQGFTLIPEKITVHVVSCTKRPMAAPGKLAENIWFHQPVVPRIGWSASAFSGCGLAVRKLLKTIKPQLTHAQGTERDCGVSMMMAPEGPRLLTIHGHMARIAEITGARFPSYYWMASRLEAEAVRRADAVISLNNYTKERVEKLASATWTIPNAVDAAFFEIRNRPEPGLALCVAGVSPWKRQLELMEALDRLPPKRRPRLLFLGSASDSPYGNAFKHALSLRGEWCDHIGHVGREELKQWLAKADLLILPSIEDNCPMVVLEAMAAGVPVAASRIGGIPELVEEGITGKLFDPRQPDDIARVVDGILAESELSNRFRMNSRCRALEKFHPKVIAENHLEFYRTVVRETAIP